jgi:hypothetical protein
MLKHACAYGLLVVLFSCSNDASMGGGAAVVKKAPAGKAPVTTAPVVAAPPAFNPAARDVPLNAVTDDTNRTVVPAGVDEVNGLPPRTTVPVDPFKSPPPPPDYKGKRQTLQITAVDHASVKPAEIVLMTDTSNSMKNHLEKLKLSLHAIPEKLTAQGVDFQLHLLSMQDLVYDATTANYQSHKPAEVTAVPADIGVYKTGDDDSALTAITEKIKINDAAITDKDKAIPYYNQPGLCAVGRYMLANDAMKDRKIHVMVLTDEDDDGQIEIANPNDSEQKTEVLLHCFPQPAGTTNTTTRDIYSCRKPQDTCADKELAPAQPLKKLAMTKYCVQQHFLCTDNGTDNVSYTCAAPDTYSGCKVYVDGQPTNQTETISFNSYMQRRKANRVEGCTPSATTQQRNLDDEYGLTGCTRNVTHPKVYKTAAEKDADTTRFTGCTAAYESPEYPYDVARNAKGQLTSVTAKACSAGFTAKTIDLSVGSVFMTGFCASELEGKTLPDGLTAVQYAATSATTTNQTEFATNAAEKTALDARSECTFQQTQTLNNRNDDEYKAYANPSAVREALKEFNVTWHAIVAKDANRCQGETTGDISRGNAYYTLSGMTSGTVSDVCDPNYDKAVQAMTEKIIQQSRNDSYTLDGTAAAIKSVINQRTGAAPTYTADGHSIVFTDGVQIGDTVVIEYQ